MWLRQRRGRTGGREEEGRVCVCVCVCVCEMWSQSVVLAVLLVLSTTRNVSYYTCSGVLASRHYPNTLLPVVPLRTTKSSCVLHSMRLLDIPQIGLGT